ncbi:unnamed protein product [Rotaria socialis]|uniref:PKD/REJ-like domain-containing protein n=1 Tax=Rotaria socialis TaxID=392032 RepID=A0A820Y7A6_9BILA|nr:unnamed protein product [Rotaria socialis]
MQFIHVLGLWLINLELTGTILEVSFHQPKFSSCASWNSTGISFVNNNNTIGAHYLDIFIDINNNIYVADSINYRIQIWHNGSHNSSRELSGNLNLPNSLFVTIDDYIYIDNGNDGRVDKWPLNLVQNISVMYVNRGCIDLFIDINNTLYCAIDNGSLIVKMSLQDNTNTMITAAGTGCAGSLPNMLDRPCGIFVDSNFNLYVADTGNNRIQQFSRGGLNGITVCGNGAPDTIELKTPTSIVLDADGYLFIVDSDNNRIIGSGPTGFRCLFGCSGSPGIASDQLSRPRSLAFDSYGNMFVTDINNDRIQMFLLATNSCDETTIPPRQTSTTNNELVTSTFHLQSTANITKTTAGESTTQLPRDQPTSAQHFNTNPSCFSPIITLFPSISSSTAPIQFRRSEDLHISSYIEVNCIASLAVITQWAVFNCRSTCSLRTKLDQSVITTLSELFIRARTLAYGLYELKLTVTMVASTDLISSASVYVRINPPNIIPNLVEFGTSMISSGQEQDLTFNPGSFSVNPDESTFNLSDWTYEYYCRTYDSNKIEVLQTFNQTNHSCFSNRSSNTVAWQYGSIVPSTSSVTIFAGSLASNQTYQFVVHMVNCRDLTFQVKGFLMVKVADTNSPKVAIACVISTMCSFNGEYQKINPNTQVALFSVCLDNCTSIKNIKWNIYKGSMNLSTDIVKWTQMNNSQDSFFFGMNTIVYTFVTKEISLSALNFIINQPPENGTCSISPLNGTTSSLFTINCLGWIDDDDIKDYSFYGWTTDRTERIMLAFTTLPTLKIRLPAGNGNTSLLVMMVHIRDMLDCMTEFYMEAPVVILDLTEINTLINVLQEPTKGATINPFVQLLGSGYQNTVGQIIILIAQELNKMNKQNIETAVENGISAASISVSSLGSARLHASSIPLNMSVMNKYNEKLNILTNVRNYLMMFITNMTITTVNSIKLQASILALLTEATNQLTRTASELASAKCHQLSFALSEIAKKISYEDAQFAATLIAQCIGNALTAINRQLQERGNDLDLDSICGNILPNDYDNDFEFVRSNLKLFIDGDDFSWEAIQKGRNLYCQMKMSIMQPLAVAGASRSQAKTNLSTSISLSLFDLNSNEISIRTSANHSIELLIPRDPNSLIPPMTLQNVTSMSSVQPFNLHVVNMTQFLTNTNLSVSLHFEIRPLNVSLGYLFIYKFDNSPELNSAINQMDGWSLLCPSNNNWQSDGLWVGPLTNHYQTQCFSTHLTTFSSSFLVQSAPLNRNHMSINFVRSGLVMNDFNMYIYSDKLFDLGSNISQLVQMRKYSPPLL